MCKRMVICLIGFAALIFIINSCAKINTPSGGQKDRTPPVVVKSVPVNRSKNFNGNKIEIDFDEYVVLDNINEKFMVSPPVKKKPRVFIKGKSVEVEFQDKLKDSTTYTLYFQDAIKDLNEGNVLQNFQFVLSTGPVLDSLSVTGNIYNANNLEVPEKTDAILYSELADSAVIKHLPEYISVLDKTGYFRIDNVHPGTYRLYGLKDEDNSKNYNSIDEAFAFLDSTVVITTEKNFIPPVHIVKDTTILQTTAAKLKKPVKKETGKYNSGTKSSSSEKKGVADSTKTVNLTGEFQLYQFLADRKTHYLTGSQRESRYEMVYTLSLPPDTMNVEFSIPDVDRKAFFTEHTRNRDTLRVWLTDSTIYSQPRINTLLKYPFTDTLGNIVYKQDTIVMRYLAPVPGRKAKIKRKAFTFDTNLSGSLKPGQNIFLVSKTPFAWPDTSRIRLYELGDSTRQKIPFQIVRDSMNSCKLYLKTKLAEKMKYLFVADSASFSNIYKEYSDSIGINFSIKDPELFDKLTFDVKNYEGGRIIQLLDKSEKLISEKYMTQDGKVVFTLLDPGTYRARVIYDLNGDRKWTTGDFTIHRQPEPVSYYPSEIELRPGFELVQTWDIGVKNFKDPKLRANYKQTGNTNNKSSSGNYK
jgi:hypothetical protein